MIGSPTDGDLKAMRVDYRTSDLPTLRPYPWTRLFPKGTEPDALAVVGELLCFDPQRRLSAAAAVDRPFFQPARPYIRSAFGAAAAAEADGGGDAPSGAGGDAAAAAAAGGGAPLSLVLFDQECDDALSALRRLAAHPDAMEDGEGGSPKARLSGGAPEWHEGFDERLSERLTKLEGAEFGQPWMEGAVAAAVEELGSWEEGWRGRAAAAADEVGVELAARRAHVTLAHAKQAASEEARRERAAVEALRAELIQLREKLAEVPAAEGAGAAVGRADAGAQTEDEEAPRSSAPPPARGEAPGVLRRALGNHDRLHHASPRPLRDGAAAEGGAAEGWRGSRPSFIGAPPTAE